MHSSVVRVAVPHDLHHTRQDGFFRVRNKKEGTFSSSDGTVGTVPQLSGKNGGRFASIRSTGGGAASAPDPTRPGAARPRVNTHVRIRSFSFHTRPTPPHPTFCLLVVGARADNVTPGLCIYLSSTRHRPTATTHRRRRGPRSHFVVARLRCPAPSRPVRCTVLHCAYTQPNISVVCRKEPDARGYHSCRVVPRPHSDDWAGLG
jgi:hypothetical protein